MPGPARRSIQSRKMPGDDILKELRENRDGIRGFGVRRERKSRVKTSQDIA